MTNLFRLPTRHQYMFGYTVQQLRSMRAHHMGKLRHLDRRQISACFPHGYAIQEISAALWRIKILGTV